MFTKATKIENVAAMNALIEQKQNSDVNDRIVVKGVKKNGEQYVVSGSTTIAYVKIGDHRFNIHNDASLVGLKFLKKWMESNEVPEQVIQQTRTGKGLVVVLPLKDGGKHNTHIYVMAANKSRTSVTVDDIDL